MRMQDLKEQRQKALLEAKAIAERVAAEGRDFEAEEKANIERLMQAAAGLKDQLTSLEQDAALVKELTELTAGLAELAPPTEEKRKMGGSWGQQVIEHDGFRAWMKSIAPNGRVPDSLKGFQSPVLEFGSVLAEIVGRKTLLTGSSDTSAGAFVQTDYTGIYEPLGRYALTLRDLISVRQTTSDVVEFVRQTAKVTQATTVAEANVTTYAGSTGEVEGAKPEAAVSFEKVTATVRTVAVWIPATKRALSDASQLRGIIDQELQEDVAEELEDQILNGAGAGEDFTGILNTSNTLTQAWDTDIPTTVRKAKTALRTSGRTVPTALLVHPEDFQTIDLLQDNDGRYLYGGPQREGMRMMWGVPIVESEAVTQGTALMGDFRKAVLWDREVTSISFSDSHEDFFTRNMVAVLAECRAAFGVIRPTAFIEIAMESGS